MEEKKGLVLDIQRSAIHDGPGVRTTVFLKGCPLRCAWCHNPESQSSKKQIGTNCSRCIGCSACVAVCKQQARSLTERKGVTDEDVCISCGACKEVCVNQAITCYGEEMDAGSVLQVVEKDRAFYEATGGGITLSGGEPLAQDAFCVQLLSLCKERSIHTCVETCGHVSTKSMEKINPLVDIFLFDFKLSDENKAKQYTGAGIAMIRKNLDFLLDGQKKVILRCPVIPGVNDDAAHFEQIKRLSENTGILSVEIMPYHNFGVIKGKNIGKEQSVFEVPSKEKKEKWLAYFNSPKITLSS